MYPQKQEKEIETPCGLFEQKLLLGCASIATAHHAIIVALLIGPAGLWNWHVVLQTAQTKDATMEKFQILDCTSDELGSEIQIGWGH